MKNDRTMVRVNNKGEVVCRLELLKQWAAKRAIIDTPPLVVFSCIHSETPPTIGHRFWVQYSVTIFHSTVKPLGHPGSFFGQKTGALFIGNRIVNINLPVGNIVIAANNQLRVFSFKRVYKLLKFIQKGVFNFLPHIP